MKAQVFLTVLAFHIVVIAGLYLLSACSTSTKTSGNQGASSTSTGGSNYDQYSQLKSPSEDSNMVVTEVRQPPASTRTLDPVFNSGSNTLGSSNSNISGGRFSPTRPSDSSLGITGQSVLNEFRDDDVLQPLTSTNASTSPVEYVVKKGDSLWKIARDFGIFLNDLMAANNLNESSTIKVGQKLTISSDTSGPPPSLLSEPQTSVGPSSSEVYTVVRGDTLSRIARDYNTTVKDIKVANNLSSDIIQLGQKMTIPVNSMSSGSSSAPSIAQISTASTPVSITTDSGRIVGDIVHKVEPGETPSGIARLYGITTSQLMNDNGIGDARSLKVGQQLQVRLRPAQPSSTPSTLPSQPVRTPTAFDNTLFENLEEFPEVEIVPRS